MEWVFHLMRDFYYGAPLLHKAITTVKGQWKETKARKELFSLLLQMLIKFDTLPAVLTLTFHYSTFI